MKIFLFVFSVLFSVNSSQAGEWNHRQLQAADGAKITIDYKFHPACHRFSAGGRSDNEIRFAGPVWINVRGQRPTSNVKVEITFYRQSKRRFGSQPNAIVRDHNHFDRPLTLSYAGEDRFTGVIHQLAVRHTVGSSYTHDNILQHLKIIVDGRALRDPVSGTDEFQISLDDSTGCNPF